jgi:hypothetical protein
VPTKKAEKIISDLNIEITELITIMNDAFKQISVSYSYTAPYIQTQPHPVDKLRMMYMLTTKTFSAKKKSTDDFIADSEEDD